MKSLPPGLSQKVLQAVTLGWYNPPGAALFGQTSGDIAASAHFRAPRLLGHVLSL